jgi:hypothetical protein
MATSAASDCFLEEDNQAGFDNMALRGTYNQPSFHCFSKTCLIFPLLPQFRGKGVFSRPSNEAERKKTKGTGPRFAPLHEFAHIKWQLHKPQVSHERLLELRSTKPPTVTNRRRSCKASEETRDSAKTLEWLSKEPKPILERINSL